MSRYYYGGWAPYVPVAERRRKAERKLAELKKNGHVCEPVVIEGRNIARTFWGKQWCDHMESHGDLANRLPRGRAYVRNGAVIELEIAASQVRALVSGSEIYQVDIDIDALGAKRWKAIVKECAGKVSSLVELLQGRLSDAVMEVVTRKDGGLFPKPKEIKFRCSCPDYAWMCKHVAAVLYGIGARLDRSPELLFLLRQVDTEELISQTGSLPLAPAGEHQVLEGADLSALFGIELDQAPAESKPSAKPKPAPRKKAAQTVSAADLLARGIPRHMIQSWLESGVLKRSGQRGVYRVTKETEARIAAYLQRRAA
jgi:uncharacterized Zn finger protein